MMLMYSDAIQSILAQIRNLPTEQRVALADEVDRLAWRDRVQVALGQIAANVERDGPISDAEIDAVVKDVRSEKSLYERYWTRRRP